MGLGLMGYAQPHKPSPANHLFLPSTVARMPLPMQGTIFHRFKPHKRQRTLTQSLLEEILRMARTSFLSKYVFAHGQGLNIANLVLHRAFQADDYRPSTNNIPLVDRGQAQDDSGIYEDRPSTWLQGQRFRLSCCALAVALVLLFNVITTVVVTSKHQTAGGVNVLQQGDCTTAQHLGTGLHLLINALGTILLGTSNYCMQCVSAPTRKDINHAHGRSKWLDIGITSVRNLRWISWPRKVIWLFLLVSSAPLHLTYNSVVFPSTSVELYNTYVVTQNFLGSTLAAGSQTATKGSLTETATVDRLARLRDSGNSLQEMDIKTCRAVLHQVIVSEWRNVVIISSEDDDSTPVLDALSVDRADAATRRSVPNRIRCGSEDPELCGAVNKTAGDGCLWADETTVDNCLVAKSAFSKRTTWASLPLPYKPKRHLWFTSASISRWLLTTAAVIATLAVAVYFYVSAYNSHYGAAAQLSIGFGILDALNTVQLNRGILSVVLLANSPQLLLSILYFAYNNLFTCMLLAEEWSTFATERKPLRVSDPVGKQTSTYRLNLPYRYGIPLIVMSTLLHWLVSQSFFVVLLEGFDGDDAAPDGDVILKGVGWSSKALLVTIVVGSVVLGFGIANGFRVYPRGMPFAGSCSAAVSAACHPPVGDDRPSRKLLRWGACGQDGELRTMKGDERDAGARDDPRVGHCSMTSLEVERPVEGRLYAGLRGAHTVFANTVTIYDGRTLEHEVNHGRALADAAVAAGVPFYIYSTLPNAGKISGGKRKNMGHFDGKEVVEGYIRTLPLRSAFIAPGSFISNFHAEMAPHPAGDGTYVFASFVRPDTQMPLIDTAGDTRKWVAAILADFDNFEGQVLCCSTALYNFQEIADAMSEVSGKKLVYKQLPEDVWRGFLPPLMQDHIAEMLQFFQEYGYFGENTGKKIRWAAERARGKLTSLEEYFKARPLNPQ
ncbi:MAG: hypothetical protein Q9219_006723 [cf. Caloplaca sp. 3 TL-2023]